MSIFDSIIYINNTFTSRSFHLEQWIKKKNCSHFGNIKLSVNKHLTKFKVKDEPESPSKMLGIKREDSVVTGPEIFGKNQGRKIKFEIFPWLIHFSQN